MAFQFQCPQGHLLEGEETDAGRQSTCPNCGTSFVVPQPTPESIITNEFPDVTGGPKVQEAVPELDKMPDLLHIPCPNGHELETPREMLNQDVLCPFCNSQFRLRENNSVEYVRRKEQEIEGQELKLGNKWMNWAIVLAALLTLALTLIIVSAVT